MENDENVMPPSAPQNEYEDQPLSRAEVSQLMLNIAAEQVTVVEKIETSKSDQKRDIIRDLSTAGLALLGGVLTLATVGQSFIRTPGLVYVGTAIVSISVILAFFFRMKIGRRYAGIIDKEYSEYSKRANAIRGVMSATGENRQRRQYELDDVIANTPFTSNFLPRVLSVSEIIVAIILIVGALLTVMGLIFKVVIG